MRFFSKLFGNRKSSSSELSIIETSQQQQLSSNSIIDTMLTTAELAMGKGDYELAIETYKDILKLEPNTTAQYNLGSLYAQGKGIKQDFMESAYYFHQAELLGDEQAGSLCLKCSMDFIHQNLDDKAPEQIYTDMMHFIKRVYPDADDINLEVCRTLYAVAGNHFNKQEYAQAAKLFRSAGEFGNDGYSQNYLAVLYNLGKGVEQNDLVALYWFDKAIDNGAADVAQQDRDGIMNAYKENLSPDEFSDTILKLSEWCRLGSKDVPRDVVKATYWRKVNNNRE